MFWSNWKDVGELIGEFICEVYLCSTCIASLFCLIMVRIVGTIPYLVPTNIRSSWKWRNLQNAHWFSLLPVYKSSLPTSVFYYQRLKKMSMTEISSVGILMFSPQKCGAFSVTINVWFVKNSQTVVNVNNLMQKNKIFFDLLRS